VQNKWSRVIAVVTVTACGLEEAAASYCNRGGKSTDSTVFVVTTTTRAHTVISLL
jgi:hypothetical protein